MKKYIFFSAIVLLIFATLGCDEKDTDLILEIPFNSNNITIDKNINGITFKFWLLDEQGNSSNVFKEGENFTFYFQIKNETGKKFYYNPYECAYIKDLFSVVDYSGKTIGKSYRALPITDIGIAAYPFNNNDEYTFKVQWQHSNKSILTGGDFKYESIIQSPLKSGKYYTSFVHKFRFTDLDEGKDLETDDIKFKINFKIE